MGYVSAKVLSETINIDEVSEGARKEWDKRQRGRRRVEQWVIRLLPVGMIVMAVVFYLLSAPHTSFLLNLITPGRGDIAPIGWEFGIIIVAAFIAAGWNNWLTKSILWTLLGLSVLINIAGGFIAVINANEIELASETVGGLLGRVGELPATYQIVLLLTLPIGFVIPIIAKFTGEAVVKMTLGLVRFETQNDDERWIQERPMVVHSALMQAAIKMGAGAKTAGNWAAAVVQSLYREDVQRMGADAVGNQRIRIVEPAHQPMGFLRRIGQPGQSNAVLSPAQNQNGADNLPSTDNNTSPVVRLSKKQIVEWLQQQPAEVQALHPKAMCKMYMAQEHGFESEAGYKTFERAKQDLGL
jgi:hypothetical protein